MLVLSYFDIYSYDLSTLRHFAKLDQIKGFEDMSCEELREALEEEGQRLAREGDEALSKFEESKEVFG
jgi:hypothetical protein